MSRLLVSGSSLFLLFLLKRTLGSFPKKHFFTFSGLNIFWPSVSCNLPRLKASLIYSIIKL